MDPLFHRKGKETEFREQKSPKIETPSKKVYQQMKKALREQIEDNESELLLTYADKIAQSMQPIPRDSPFADTDLVVFNDDFKGILPRNGIKKNDLQSITKIYNEIYNGKSKISIEHNSYDNDRFFCKIMQCIKILSTREIGRKLIKKVIEEDDSTLIVEGTDGSECIKNKIIIDDSDRNNKFKYIAQHPSGKLTLLKNNALFIGLGHEMFHRIHKERDVNVKKKPQQPEFDNKEEEIAITGESKDAAIPESNQLESESDNWEPILPKGYDELNENNLIMAFTGALTEFESKLEIVRYPRFGHHAIDVMQKESEVIKELVMENVLYDLELLFKQNKVTKDVLSSTYEHGDLHVLAVECGRLEILKFLLDIDPHPNLLKPLYLTAIKEAKPEILEYLLKIDPKLQPPEGETLVDVIFNQRYKESRDVFNLLKVVLDTEIDVNAPISLSDGNTLLHVFVGEGDVETVKKIIGKGGNIHLKNQFGYDPIKYFFYNLKQKDVKTFFQMITAMYKKDELIDKLIELQFAKYIFKGMNEDTTLDCLDFLYNSEYDFNKLDKDGQTLMHYAFLYGNPLIINKLKKWNCNFNIKNRHAKDPITYSLEQLDLGKKEKIENYCQMTSLIYKGDELRDKLMLPARKILEVADENAIFDYITFLQNSGIDINKPDKKGQTLMHYAILYSNPLAIKKLKELNCDFNIKNQKHQDIIEYAFRKSIKRKYQDELLGELYDKLKNIYTDDELFEKLMVLARKFIFEKDKGIALQCLNFLHTSRYDFNKLDKNGQTLIHYAVLTYDSKIIDQLKKWNCNFDVKNTWGRTPASFLMFRKDLYNIVANNS